MAIYSRTGARVNGGVAKLSTKSRNVLASIAKTMRPRGNLLRMPELPDITAYISALEPRISDQTLQHVRLGSPISFANSPAADRQR